MPNFPRPSQAGFETSMITSTANPKVKWVRLLQAQGHERRAAGVFIVEGVRLAEEALAAGWEAQLVLFTQDLTERGRLVLDGFAARGAPLEQVSPEVLRAASDTETPQGLLAVLSQRLLPLPEALDFVFIPDRVRDPGNLGTMLRTAAAAGVQAVFCPPETVDAFAPKVLRAGMGAHFRLPIHNLDWDALARRLAPLQVFLAAMEEGPAYNQVDFRIPLALIVGGEAEGAGLQARRLAHASVNIPMPGGGESLNAAVAAGILLFEVVRQRAGSRAP
jgi:TrmH family RNA methyltransferase